MNHILFALPIARQLAVDIAINNNHITSLRYILMKDNRSKSPVLSDKEDVFAEQIKHQLRDYFAPQKMPDKAFSLKLDWHQGTMFQQKVWRALLKIPYGEVVTYGVLAKQLDSCAQAIGNACRHNRFPLIVPCHRVVAARGIGGYAGDTVEKQKGDIHFLQVKQWLLAHERKHCQQTATC